MTLKSRDFKSLVSTYFTTLTLIFKILSVGCETRTHDEVSLLDYKTSRIATNGIQH